MPLLDPTFVASNNPAVNVQATASRAARAGFSHTCQTIHSTINQNSTAGAAVQTSVVLRDGPPGTGAVIWASQMSVPATAGQSSPPIEISGLAISGTPGNAMTLEFTGPGGTNTFQTVAFTGFDT